MFAVRGAAVSRRCLTLIVNGWNRSIGTQSGIALRLLAGNHEVNLRPNAVLMMSWREYAKAKGRQGSSKHSSDKPKTLLKDEEMEEIIRVGNFRDSMARSLQRLGDSFLKQLTVSNPANNIESIPVNFEGSEVQLCEVAQIQKKQNLVVLQFTAFPEAIKSAMKAVQESGTRASIQQDGTSVYLNFPKVTREQREDMAKSAKMLFQKCKDDLVQLERRVLKDVQMKKDGVSEDLIFDVQQQVKYEISQSVAKAEQMMKTKQNELLKES